MEDSSCSGKISNVSHQSTLSKKSIGGVVIEGHLITVVPMHGDNTQEEAETIEVNTTKLKEEGKKKQQKQKKKVTFTFFASTLNKTKTLGKKRWLKKFTQLKKKWTQNSKSPAIESTPIVTPATAPEAAAAPDAPVEENLPLQVVDVVEVKSVEEKTDSTEDVQQVVVMKASTVETEKPTAETDAAKGFDCCSPAAMWGNFNGWFKDPTKAKEEVVAESVKAEDVAEVEEKKESPDEEQVVMNTSTVGAEEPTEERDAVAKAEEPTEEKDVAKGFDCISPAAILGDLGWFKDPTNAQEEMSAAALIEAIKARWLPSPEDTKPSLNEETAADIIQAVDLLNAQRTLIKEAKEAIEKEEEVIQDADNVKEFQEAEANKARLKKELSDAKRLEKAAKELVHHLFNSLTAKDRSEAILLSDDIAKAEAEVKKDDGIDFGCLRMDPYIRTAKAQYADACFDDLSQSTFGGSIRRNNSTSSSKASSKAPPKVPTMIV